MTKLITRFEKDLGILVVEPEDYLSPDFIMEYYQNLTSNESYPRDLKALCITRARSYPISTRDLEELVETLRMTCGKYNTFREAFLAEDPYMTVITTLFSEKADMPNYRSGVFSTEEAAIKWLLE